ncbi:DeoR/GlpR family DNA-binding transcription regulator [Halomonas sp. SpR1]|uniref:DeoR/GlpR family DNA-binding transcription regulator n=1 Tax=Halomonas sp. SpR1 TaxID=3050462 RepID=UPI0027E51398|nr:DeoR/GlpR family DNA-binding transcription regulator [Halomonas sp. SpR1]MDQ7734187.1 DeoR/GlpR family DNA-binding transcription regulator [Halomonas sp. SpR1]
MLNVPETRQQQLLTKLASGEQLIAQDLAVEFDVSLDTIRRDIIALEQQGKAQRVRGGAVATAPTSPPLQYRVQAHSQAIDAIAARASSLINLADTLLLDGGATVLALAERLQPKPGRLVMTPSPWVAVACQKNGIEVFMLGGQLGVRGGVNVGDTALLAAANLYADITILGACGLDAEFGLSADDLQEAHLKHAMSRAAKRTLVLASREKIGRRARHRAVAIEDIDCLITDAVAVEVEEFGSSAMEVVHA